MNKLQLGSATQATVLGVEEDLAGQLMTLWQLERALWMKKKEVMCCL